MATENIVLLACAAVLCTLHVAGGPLSGLFRKPPAKRRPVVRLAEEHPRVAEPATMTNGENEVISRAS